MPLPPRILRRLIIAPLVLALSLALVALSPILLALAALVDLALRRRRWQTVRVVAFGELYLVLEIGGLLALFGLWIASGFGLWMRTEPLQWAHYAVLRWLLRWAGGAARAVFRLRIWVEGSPRPEPGPVLVFSRHAGPGNSLMLVGTIMIGYHRRPRIVMLAKLQWEPLFDAMLNRLPNRFIEHDSSDRQRSLDMIGELAAGLDEHGALVMFPEGRDFTHRLRLRAIAYLRRKGYHRHARKAEKLGRVLPPKHGGVMAAISAAPDADVVFVAHTVLEDIGSFRDLWDRVPFEEPILAHYWRVPPETVPKDRDALIDWLYEWWKRIDTWIDERRAPGQPPRSELGAREG